MYSDTPFPDLVGCGPHRYRHVLLFTFEVGKSGYERDQTVVIDTYRENLSEEMFCEMQSWAYLQLLEEVASSCAISDSADCNRHDVFELCPRGVPGRVRRERPAGDIVEHYWEEIPEEYRVAFVTALAVVRSKEKLGAGVPHNIQRGGNRW